MSRQLGVLTVVIVLLLSATAYTEHVVPLAGKMGHSTQWGSGWLDLASARDFKRGDRLRLTIGGSATKIVVRLLPEDDSPDDPAGIVGIEEVPKNRTLEMTLSEDHPNVRQISVHGNDNPWGQYPLGAENGPATLQSADLVSP